MPESDPPLDSFTAIPQNALLLLAVAGHRIDTMESICAAEA